MKRSATAWGRSSTNMREIRSDTTNIVNVETAHERSDVNVRALLWAVAFFVILAIVMHTLLWLLFKWFAQQERGNVRPQLTQIQRPSDASVPKNQPLLQPFPPSGSESMSPDPFRNTPVTDLSDMRAREDAVLHHYGWVNKQQGVVHIPIEDAKRIALQRGFPVNAGAAPAPPPTTTGGDR